MSFSGQGFDARESILTYPFEMDDIYRGWEARKGCSDMALCRPFVLHEVNVLEARFQRQDLEDNRSGL